MQWIEKTKKAAAALTPFFFTLRVNVSVSGNKSSRLNSARGCRGRRRVTKPASSGMGKPHQVPVGRGRP